MLLRSRTLIFIGATLSRLDAAERFGNGVCGVSGDGLHDAVSFPTTSRFPISVWYLVR